jgi:DHA2 family multidrug resistance protein
MDGPQTYTPPTRPDGRVLNPWFIAVAVAMTTFMEVLDISIANVSLRHIAGDMAVSQDESTWVLTSYMVANAIILPMSGWLSNLMGRRRLFLTCVVLFTTSSLLCGLAPSLPLLIVFRVLQGLAGGGLQPSSQAILTDSFPLEKRGMAFAVYGLTAILAPAIGPTVGGWITDNYTWRWIFFINIPVGIISYAMCTRLVFDPKYYTDYRQKLKDSGFAIDYFGFILMALGLGLLQILLDKGQQDDWWRSSFITGIGLISACSLILFVFWELEQDNPMVDIRLLLNKNFLVSNILIFLLGFILFGSTALLPLMLQTLMGYSATDSGMVLSPGALTVLFFMPLIGYLMNKVDVRHLITFGMLANGIALYLLAHVTPQTDYWVLAEYRVIQGIGLGFLFIPISAAGFDGVPAIKYNNASALISLSRNLGGSVGIAIMETLMVRSSEQHQSDLGSHLTAFSVAAQQQLSQLTEYFSRHRGNGIYSPLTMAQDTLYGILQRQASFLAFMDDFQILSWICLGFIPLVYTMKRSQKYRK